jgi:uncharacterized protein YjbI with pentapeptide repeats
LERAPAEVAPRRHHRFDSAGQEQAMSLSFSANLLGTLCAAAVLSAHAGEMSVQDVRSALQGASAMAPADLSGKDLSDLDLSGIDFKQANLRRANFFGSKLVQANLSGAHLEEANLNGAWLMGTNFTGAHLARASLLSVVILGGAVKQMPVFKDADLREVKLIADLPGADLRGADFRGAMVGVNIKNQGMGQMRTDLSGAKLNGAQLAGADFNRTLMSYAQLQGSDLRGANFFRARLVGADLSGADIAGADFSEADLDAAVLRDVKGYAQAKGLDRATNLDKVLR